MTAKIFRSIFAVAGAVLLMSLVIIMGCLYDYSAAVQETQLKNQLELAATATESMGADYLEALPAEGSRLTWVAADGRVILDTRAGAETMENHADRKEIRQALESGEGESVRYSSTLMKKTVYYAKALSDGSVLRISADRATLGTLSLGMAPYILLTLLLALVLSALLAGRLAKRIVEPLNTLDLERPMENRAYEELSPLLARVNSLHREINRQLELLRRQKEEFAQITGSMREGLVLLDEGGAVLSINPAARRIFAVQGDCAGRDFLTLERGSDISQALSRAMDQGHSELRTERRGLEYRIDISRIDLEGKAQGAVLLAFDVSEEAFAERNRREFTANVSHELKTPLQSIIGSAELIENGLVKAEDMPRFVGHIRAEAARMVTLIDDIIRLSQLDEGVETPAEEVELLALAREAAESLRDAAKAGGVTLEVSGEEQRVRGVRRLLYETVYNLCDNAIKYNVAGGRVDIRVSRDGDRAVIAVRDTGIGIPPEHQARVFERFYRVDKSHSRASGGTGLGLSIVKHAVQYHKGSIELDSESGKGTEIRVLLPAEG